MNRKGFVVSAVLYPLLVLFLALIMGLISMSSTRKNILDNMKMEISDSTFDEAECTCETILNKLNYIIKNGVGGGVGNIISLNVNNYPSKDKFPTENNNKNDIAIVSNVSVAGYYLQDYEPSSPIAGSVWIIIHQTSNNKIDKETMIIPIAQVKQYQNGSWVPVTSSIYNGTNWIDLNSSLDTATAEDIAYGKTAIVNGNKVVGTDSQSSKFPGDNKFASDEFSYDNNNAVKSYRTTTTMKNDTGTVKVASDWEGKWTGLSGMSGELTCPENGGCLKDSDGELYCTGTKCSDNRTESDTTWTVNLDSFDDFKRATKIKITLLNHNNDETTVSKSGVDAFYTRMLSGYEKSSETESGWGVIPEIVILKDKNSMDVISVTSNIDVDVSRKRFVWGSEDSNTDSRIVDLTSFTDQSQVWKNSFSVDTTSVVTGNLLTLTYKATNISKNDVYGQVRGFKQVESMYDTENNWVDRYVSNGNWDTIGYNANQTMFWYYKEPMKSTNLVYDTPRIRMQSQYVYWDVSIGYYE